MTDQHDQQAVDAQVAAAVREVFPADVAEVITFVEDADDSSFGALAYRVGQQMREREMCAAAVLRLVEDGEREFAGRASDPAAFLAVRVRDLPPPAVRPVAAEMVAEGPVTSGGVLREVAEIVAAVRMFSRVVEETDLERPAAQLPPVQLAWLLDRVDDVRADASTLLQQLAAAVVRHDVATTGLVAAEDHLDGVGHALYGVVRQLDPGDLHHTVEGLGEVGGATLR
ncbi:MAG TPA: hypothetical protein VGL46_21575 [Pseudonocardiaceae bacterium]|jgi:hypothetical protein